MNSPHPLPLTGERTLPGIPHENYWFTRHVAAYRLAARHAQGKIVLDAGCGEGYGSSLLAGGATSVVGVDLVEDVVTHARASYPMVEFVAADLCDLPMPDASFDVVVSLQVIEHLPDLGRYLRETARVLRPGGQFICATPNRLTFTPGSNAPVNPFHITEFAPEELSELLNQQFRVRALLGLHHGPRLRAVERVVGHSLPDAQLAAPPPAWPLWLTAAVRLTRPRDFRFRADRLPDSLDLIAITDKIG